VVLLAFVGMGVAWTAEQTAPQFHKRFPWLPVILGISAGAILVALLTGKKEQKHTLTVTIGTGVSGTPASTASYGKG
jgi:hypothetical protein